MQSTEEFRNFYNSKFNPLLKELEKSRQKILMAALIAIAMSVLFMVSLGNRQAIGSIGTIAIGVIAGLYTLHAYKDYRATFKTKVVRAILKHLNPGYKFFYDQHILYDTFIDSGLYEYKPESITGDDYVTGVFKDVRFEMCEINAWVEQGVQSSSSFKGLYFQVHLTRSFGFNTYVFPEESLQQYFEKPQKEKLKDRGSRVRMTDDQFETLFSVYSTNEEEARQIITTDVMKILMVMQGAFKKNILTSFVGDKVYFAIDYGHGLFEPKIWWDHGVSPSEVMDIYQLFKLMENTVEQLGKLGGHTVDNQVVNKSVRPSLQEKIEPEQSAEIREETNSEQDVPLLLNEALKPKGLDLDSLHRQVEKLEESMPKRDLQEYLQALYADVLAHKDEEITQDLLIKLLTDSFSSESYPMDESWLTVNRAPDKNKAYRSTASAENLQSNQLEVNSNWEPFEFTKEVLKFQIAELHKMRDNQLKNEMRNYGVSSQTGHSWYNFDPTDNLESGIRYMLDRQIETAQLDWSIIGEILEYGRVYE